MIQLQEKAPWETTDPTQPQMPAGTAAGALPPLATPAVSTTGSPGSTGASGATGGTDTNPSIPTPGLTPTNTTATPLSVPPKANDATPSTPTSPDSVMGISALPDGAGGSVTVPPIALAPAGVVPPMAQITPPASPTDVTPSIPAGTPPTVGTTPPGAAVTSTDLAPWDVPTGGAAAPGTFNATDNLLSSEVLPGADPRLSSLQSMQDTALGKVVNGPDRLALAKQYLESLNPGLDTQYSHDLTDATNAAAAHGQLGSGMLTNRYGDLFSNLEQTKKADELRYLTDAATGTIGDNQNAVADTSNAASQAFGQGQATRNETRTERGYQTDQATQALIERIQQQQAESAANQQAFDNAVRLYGVGSANNPETAYETAAQQATSEAGGQTADVGQLLAILAQRKYSQPAATPAPAGTPGGY